MRRTVFVATESAESAGGVGGAGGAATFYETSCLRGRTAASLAEPGAAGRALIVAQKDGAVLTPMSSFPRPPRPLGASWRLLPLRRAAQVPPAVEVLAAVRSMDLRDARPMDLHTVLDKLSCAAAVREADHTLWSHPKGLQFLDGTRRCPTRSGKVSSYQNPYHVAVNAPINKQLLTLSKCRKAATRPRLRDLLPLVTPARVSAATPLAPAGAAHRARIGVGGLIAPRPCRVTQL